jgi:hypothetical protein
MEQERVNSAGVQVRQGESECTKMRLVTEGSGRS